MGRQTGRETCRLMSRVTDDDTGREIERRVETDGRVRRAIETSQKTQRWVESQTDGQGDRLFIPLERQRDGQRDKQTDIQTDRETSGYKDVQRDRYTDEKKDELGDGQTCRVTECQFLEIREIDFKNALFFLMMKFVF